MRRTVVPKLFRPDCDGGTEGGNVQENGQQRARAGDRAERSRKLEVGRRRTLHRLAASAGHVESAGSR
eukprot:1081580-Pleurochrysis_carterae.AAC.2